MTVPTQILQGSAVTEGKGWNTANILSGLTTTTITTEVADGVYKVTVAESDYHFEDTAIPAVAEAMYKADGTAAQAYMQKLTDYGALSDANKINMAKTITAVAKMNALLGASHTHFIVGNNMEEGISEHLNLQKDNQGKEIWAKVLRTKENVNGLNLISGQDYKIQYNGTTVGADLIQKDKLTLGAALTYAQGDVNNNYSSKSETKHIGVSLYGRQMITDNEAVTFDLSCLHGRNEMDFYTVVIKTSVTGDQDINSLSIGGRWEKKLDMGKNSSILPHAGLRYLRTRNSGFTNSVGMHYDSAKANTFVLPMGIGVKASMENGGWKMSVKGDIGYQWNLGNKDFNQDISFNGSVNSVNTTFADSNGWYAGAGIEVNRKNLTAGVSYHYSRGDSTKQNRWSVNLGFSF